MKKIIRKLLTICGYAIAIYFAVCFIEFTCKNSMPNPEYSKYNIINNAIEFMVNCSKYVL